MFRQIYSFARTDEMSTCFDGFQQSVWVNERDQHDCFPIVPLSVHIELKVSGIEVDNGWGIGDHQVMIWSWQGLTRWRRQHGQQLFVLCVWMWVTRTRCVCARSRGQIWYCDSKTQLHLYSSQQDYVRHLKKGLPEGKLIECVCELGEIEHIAGERSIMKGVIPSPRHTPWVRGDERDLRLSGSSLIRWLEGIKLEWRN